MSLHGSKPFSVCGLTDNIHVAAVCLSDQYGRARMHLPLPSGREGRNSDSTPWHTEMLGLPPHGSYAKLRVVQLATEWQALLSRDRCDEFCRDAGDDYSHLRRQPGLRRARAYVPASRQAACGGGRQQQHDEEEGPRSAAGPVQLHSGARLGLTAFLRSCAWQHAASMSCLRTGTARLTALKWVMAQ